MDDRDFFDVLYQGWSKTTGAQDKFWMPEEVAERFDGFNVYAVDQDQKRELVAQNLTEVDAAFITAVHGCFADLTRRLHMAIDESDRLDLERDQQEGRYAEVVLENLKLRESMKDLELQLDEVGRGI